MPPPPTPHLEILHDWSINLAKGMYDSESQNDLAFIRRILIDVLGYIDSSDTSYSYTLAKNLPIGKGRVDVALGYFSVNEKQIIAPLELKGAKTQNLDVSRSGSAKSPVQQAWDYAMDAKGAQWVLVSNYREIRLYAVGYGRKDYEIFDLSALSDPVNYHRFMLLLSADNLLKGHTLNLLKESENKDKEISAKLYQDYKTLRQCLMENITKESLNITPLEVIQYTQTILDRVLFVAFAEDRRLLPPDTIKLAYEATGRSFDLDSEPRWESFKRLFRAIDQGSPSHRIHGYNGGLFAPNPNIDELHVSDDVCQKFKELGEYDFDSDISVNILGHILEGSIADLEELKARVDSNITPIDENKKKRKMEGTFYTQPYITRFIVEQAVGGWLNRCKQEIGFDELPELTEEDYSPKTREDSLFNNQKVEQHLNAWRKYQRIVSGIKVLDPACGSGAFLNEVYDFLLQERNTINAAITVFNGKQSELFQHHTDILINNIYGVDFNKEAVEISKLSLWLKTAKPSETLVNLDNNIKLGNSLIDDTNIAGYLAFKWEDEFSDIMEAGGFDVVVGNPPYIFTREKISPIEKNYYVATFATAQYQLNTYLLFIEKSYHLIKQNTGRLSFIVPQAFLMVSSAEKLRKLLLEQSSIESITDLPGSSFDKVSVETIILDFIKREVPKNHRVKIHKKTKDNNFIYAYDKAQEIFYENETYKFQIYMNAEDSEVIDRIKSNSLMLQEVAEIKSGLKAYQIGKGKPKQVKKDVKERIFDYNYKFDNNTYKYLDGKDVLRYAHNWRGKYLRYGNFLAEPRSLKFFSNDVIIIREISGNYPRSIVATLSKAGEVYLFNISNIAVLTKEGSDYDIRYLLSILCSNVISYYFKRTTAKSMRQMFPKIILNELRQFPIKIASKEEQLPFIKKVEFMLAKNKELQEQSTNFLNLLLSEFELKVPGRKLEQWHALTVSMFISELKRKKINLTLQQKNEWIEYFNNQKIKADELKQIIEATDVEINNMAYSLYRLNPEEIALIEGQ